MLTKQSTMPKLHRQEDNIDWKNSSAKALLLKDLNDGVLPLDKDEVSAEEAWNSCYVNLPEFANVGFDQFKRQLKAHRQQVKEKKHGADTQEAALLHDRRLYPEKYFYADGRRIFRMSPAQELLQTDVADGYHRKLSPAELRNTRAEYAEWELKTFRQRIYQAERRQKFINYLNAKREEARETKHDKYVAERKPGTDTRTRERKLGRFK
jgi:hypothetical protein